MFIKNKFILQINKEGNKHPASNRSKRCLQTKKKKNEYMGFFTRDTSEQIFFKRRK